MIDSSLAAWLVIDLGAGEGLEYPMKDTMRIGRAVDNDILVLEVESRLRDGTENNWHGIYCRYNDADNYYVAAFSADGY